VYSTCSLEPEENEHVVTAVLAENSKVRQIPLAQSLEKMADAGVLMADGAKLLREAITPEGALRLLPGNFGTDGFFIALLERAQ